jgi:hypothetical protein
VRSRPVAEENLALLDAVGYSDVFGPEARFSRFFAVESEDAAFAAYASARRV